MSPSESSELHPQTSVLIRPTIHSVQFITFFSVVNQESVNVNTQLQVLQYV